MTYSDEIWKDIVGYEGLYQVSNYGEIKSLRKNKKIYQSINNAGYKVVSLYKNNKSIKKTVHRLVAIAFIPNFNNLPQVNHIDGIKINNNLNNLEWCDNKYNQKHASMLGLTKKRDEICSIKNGIKIIQYDLKDNYIKEWKNMKEASRTLKIDNSAISKCCRGKRNKCGGFKWKYKEVIKK